MQGHYGNGTASPAYLRLGPAPVELDHDVRDQVPGPVADGGDLLGWMGTEVHLAANVRTKLEYSNNVKNTFSAVVPHAHVLFYPTLRYPCPALSLPSLWFGP